MSKAKQGQSFFDKVVQHTGSIENCIEIAVKNGTSITDDLVIGSELLLVGSINERMVATLARRSEPATALSTETLIPEADCGIGCMIIESTFKVY